ncbi:MAG TPA: hypothetical protein VM146_06130 [Steroidobacteraceae bacterium]|nr:hypothetical protein [Steroidobacteraceae bacterium]
MKFAYSKAGNGRSQMRERQRRDRARTPILRARFPQFGALRLEFDFRDAGPFTPAPQVAVLHPPAPAYFVFPCPYSDCDGEFDLTSAIDTMASEDQQQCEGQMRCAGHRSFEGSAGMPCALTLEFQVAAKND